MTTDLKDQPAPPGPGGFREGIYLESKKSSIGTGSTAKKAEYRHFWATASLNGDSAVMALLDDAFNPTPVVETFSLEALTGPNWLFVAEGEKKYIQLRPFLDRMLAALAKKRAEAEAAPAKPDKPANWWGGGAPSGPPANPLELKKDPKKPAAPAKKGGWWEK
jgi:hypothetical protein